MSYAQTTPVAGAVGFYGPDPGSHKSPNLVLEVRDNALLVYEAPTRMAFEISRDDWMDLEAMQEKCRGLLADTGHEYRDRMMEEHLRALLDALQLRALDWKHNADVQHAIREFPVLRGKPPQ